MRPGTPGFHRRSDEAMKRCPVEIGDSCHADATDAFAVLLCCDDDQHLAVDQAAGGRAPFQLGRQAPARSLRDPVL